MKHIHFVPYWLKGFLERRQLGLDVVVDFDRLQSIMSEEDVKSYCAAQDIARLPSIYNPLRPLFDDKLFSVRECSEERLVPASDDPEQNFRWLVRQYPELLGGLETTQTSELFYRALISGEYSTMQPSAMLHHLITFDIEYVQDNMVVIASPSEHDIRQPSVRAAVMDKCIEKLHLSMSFEQIAATGIFGSYLSNRFWDMRT